jgi:hypothetical protein
MKRKPRKLVLTRETLRALETGSLRLAGGGTGPYSKYCTDACDTHFECSTDCMVPTNVWYACV